MESSESGRPLLSLSDQEQDKLVGLSFFKQKIGSTNFLFIPEGKIDGSHSFFSARAACYQQITNEVGSTDFSEFDDESIQVVAINETGELVGGARWQRQTEWEDSYLGKSVINGGLGFEKPPKYNKKSYIHTGRLWSESMDPRALLKAQGQCLQALVKNTPYGELPPRYLIGSLSFSGKLSEEQVSSLIKIIRYFLDTDQSNIDARAFLQSLPEEETELKEIIRKELTLLSIYCRFYNKEGLFFGEMLKDTSDLDTWDLLLRVDLSEIKSEDIESRMGVEGLRQEILTKLESATN